MLGINLLRIVQEGHEENHRLPYETCMMFVSEGLAEAGAVGCLLNIYSLSFFIGTYSWDTIAVLPRGYFALW